MRKKTSRSGYTDDVPFGMQHSYGSISTSRPMFGENEYETARFRNNEAHFVEEQNGISGRKSSNPKGANGFDPMQALAALSFGFGESLGTDLEMDVPPRWTGDTIDSICRKLFPCAFVLFNTFYWTYYILQNHYAKERALNALFEK
uniref:Uncharacterized protein n=1 Tax=Panagrolaimus davidi TaxID=227884 RepID=A0A914R320_9BILA